MLNNTDIIEIMLGDSREIMYAVDEININKYPIKEVESIRFSVRKINRLILEEGDIEDIFDELFAIKINCKKALAYSNISFASSISEATIRKNLISIKNNASKIWERMYTLA